MDKPIFISGLRKSGTSLTKNLLDGHPDLFVYPPNELHFFRYSHHESLVKDKQREELNPNKLLELLSNTHFINRMSDNSKEYNKEINIDGFKSGINGKNVDTYPEVFDALFQSMAEATKIFNKDPSSVRFTSKTVLETEFFPILRQWFSDLKFVYVLRNPYGHFSAARLSMRATDGKEGDDVSSISDPYPIIGKEIRRMVNSYYFMKKYNEMHPDQFHVLVFDELLRNPEKEIEKLCSFLDIDYRKELTNPTICKQPWGGNSWHTGDFEGISKEPLHHWKDDISGGEIKLINEYFERIFDEFNFDQLESDKSMLLPFDSSEWNPKTYIANRVIYSGKKVNLLSK
jgi:hypothetical protein